MSKKRVRSCCHPHSQLELKLWFSMWQTSYKNIIIWMKLALLNQNMCFFYSTTYINQFIAYFWFAPYGYFGPWKSISQKMIKTINTWQIFENKVSKSSDNHFKLDFIGNEQFFESKKKVCNECKKNELGLLSSIFTAWTEIVIFDVTNKL